MRRLGVVAVFALMSAFMSVLPTSSAHGAEAGCQRLGDDQVKDGSQPLTVVMESESEMCFELPDGVGAGYLAQLAEDFDAVSALDIEDASGNQLCDYWVHPDRLVCLLEGQAPFRLRVRTSSWNESAFGHTARLRIRVLRATGDSGCQRVELQPFGSGPQAAAPHSEWNLDCYSLHLPAGALPMPSGADATSSGPTVVLLDDQGQPVCQWFEPGCQPLDSAVDVTMFVANGPYVVSLYDARSLAGCRAGIDTQWTAPAPGGRIRDASQLDCWQVPAQPGERLVLGAAAVAPMGLGILDADGQWVCFSTDASCRLQGPAPYRLIGADQLKRVDAFAPYDYRVAARSIDPGSGCPLITRRPFGEAAADLHPGIGCRQFDVQPGQTLQIGAVDVGDSGLFGAVLIGPDGQLVDHAPLEPFYRLQPGRHTLYANPVSDDFITLLHSVADPSGCQPIAADLTPVSTRLPLGAADCYRLDSLPGDQVHPISLTTERSYPPRVVLVDALGAPACDPEEYGYCTLTGIPPFRAVVGAGEGIPYLFAVLDRDDPPTCRSLTLGSRSGVLVQFSAETRIDCLTLPSVPDGTTAVHVRRLTGSGGSVLVDIPNSFSCTGSDVWFSPVRRYRCAESGNPSDTHDVLIVGDGHDQISYVAATSPAVSIIDEPGITRFRNVAAPRLRGKPVVGRRLQVDPGRWAPAVPGIRFAYRWTVGGKAVRGAKGRTLTLRPQYAGKPVRVRVTADTSTLLPGQAMSASVRVRRH